MAVISNQVQNLTEKLLNPFFTHNINMQVFFQVIAEMVRQSEKMIEDKIKEEIRKRE
jgi:hypothetical protein